MMSLFSKIPILGVHVEIIVVTKTCNLKTVLKIIHLCIFSPQNIVVM